MDQPLASQAFDQLTDMFTRMRTASREAQLPIDTRKDWLLKLRELVGTNENRLAEAISADFGHRSATETLIAESLFILGEIKHTLKHLDGWAKPRRVATQLQYFPSHNRLIPQALGIIGIMAPWNYPLQLTLAPLVAAIAAGNRAMIKPSELTPTFSALLKELISRQFAETEIYVTDIDGDIGPRFSALPFDHLLFTGSTAVGRKVAEAAGRNLTPVTLELGGKSPAIIDKSADIAEAAERIAYGKLLNAGQTCIAPDYVLIDDQRLDEFVAHAHKAMVDMYGTRADNTDYTSIISQRHFERLGEFVADAVSQGASITRSKSHTEAEWAGVRKFPPTIISRATKSMKVMQSEIFGPLLPVVACVDIDAAIRYINEGDRPLALYWFGTDEVARDRVIAETVSGGVTVNDCLFHVTQINQPFGGVGPSGTGAYHGQFGFDSFSKLKPVFYRSRFSRLSDVYPPYGAKLARMVKLLRFLS